MVYILANVLNETVDYILYEHNNSNMTGLNMTTSFNEIEYISVGIFGCVGLIL